VLLIAFVVGYWTAKSGGSSRSIHCYGWAFYWHGTRPIVNNWPVLENAHTPTWCAEPSECGRSALVLSVRSDDNDGAAAPEDVALHAGHIRREGNVVRVFS
jgi:hypothetical protein